jgi:hypothetical protein
VLGELIKRAQRQGSLRKDITPDDIGMLMGGLCASMSGPFPGPRDWHRHLDILLDGLRAQPAARPKRAS